MGRKGGHDPAWLWILLYNSHHQHILHGYFSSLSELWKVSIVWKYCAMEFTRWQPRKLKKDIFHLTDGRLCHISHKNSGCMWYSNITSGRKSGKNKLFGLRVFIGFKFSKNSISHYSYKNYLQNQNNLLVFHNHFYNFDFY